MSGAVRDRHRVDGLTHAGGVVASLRHGEPSFLLVRASRAPHHWVLPKGHIEAGETPEQTAEREVLEEAGVDAEVVAPIGDVAFEYGNQSLRIRYFLMRARGTKTALEDREICWCSPADAEQLLEFENVKEIVRRATETDARR
jgi:8-oxo-dGTP pyrophosphatase MutT (NUDIX family)